jgi:addiction module HigA family antidote
MGDITLNQYQPEEVSPPGETLLEALDAIGMSQAELAERTGRPKKTINEIIKGRAAITPATALQLERALGVPAAFWNNRERHYRESLARSEERDQLGRQVAWLKRFPVRSMIKLGWISEHHDKVQQLRTVLNFFGVASPEQWETIWLEHQGVAFRKSPSFEADPGAVAAWLRQGELQAISLDCSSYEPGDFRKALLQARELTRLPPEKFQPELEELCSRCGVAVVFVPELPKTRASGATRWLTSSKALIQLSLRYKTDDHLWFTFFHEAAHILLHGKRALFLEEAGVGHEEKEEEANRFAAEILIPGPRLRRFVAGKGSRFSKASIKRFAEDLGVAPGIVVGRLQHEGLLPRTHCNGLKRRLEWAQS